MGWAIKLLAGYRDNSLKEPLLSRDYQGLGQQLLQLPRFFVDELPAPGPGGLWLQADGCCSKASWVAVETSAAGNIALARGWQTFARARGLGRRCTLHFKYDGGSTLYVRVFGEDGCRAGC